MLEQVALLPAKDRVLVEAFASDGKLPHPLPNALVTAMDKVFKRFEVRKVSRDEIWHELFPEDAPATIGELRDRFETFVAKLSEDASSDRLRIVPSHDADS